MNITDLVTGTRLELEILDENAVPITPHFASQLEWAPDENTVVIAAPIFEGNIYPVHTGCHMNVYFQDKDDLYMFRTVIGSRFVKDDIARLVLKKESEIERIQRREFFRLKCTLPVKYRTIRILGDKSEKEPFKRTVTIDLSGGGLCLKLKEEIKAGKLLECEIELNEKQKIHFAGTVIRLSELTDDLKYRHMAGVVFRKISHKDKEAIIRFIFEEQRKLMKKGLIRHHDG